MTQRPRFAALRQAPAGLWRRVPPMIFAPILGALGLALAWRLAAEGFGLPPMLPGFLAGVAAALFGFGTLAYLVKLSRRPAVLSEEMATLPGRVGLGAALLSLALCGGVLAPYAPGLGRVMLVLALAALPVLSLLFRRHHRASGQGLDGIGPETQFGPAGLLVAAMVAPMLGWAKLGAVLLYPGALLALVLAVFGLRQLRRRRVPRVLLPLLALHLMPVAAYGAAAAQLSGPFLMVAYGLTLAGLLLLPWVAIRAGTGLFLAVLAIPLALAAVFFALLVLVFPGWWFVALLAALVLVAATLVCVPVTFLLLRDWARGRLATRSNAAIA